MVCGRAEPATGGGGQGYSRDVRTDAVGSEHDCGTWHRHGGCWAHVRKRVRREMEVRSAVGPSACDGRAQCTLRARGLRVPAPRRACCRYMTRGGVHAGCIRCCGHMWMTMGRTDQHRADLLGVARTMAAHIHAPRQCTHNPDRGHTARGCTRSQRRTRITIRSSRVERAPQGPGRGRHP